MEIIAEYLNNRNQDYVWKYSVAKRVVTEKWIAKVTVRAKKTTGRKHFVYPFTHNYPVGYER